jgi:hypothetical protein
MFLAFIMATALAGPAAPRLAAPCESCDDGNPCTVDSCALPTGCRHVDVARCNYPHAATQPLPSGSSCTPIPSCPIPDSDGDGLNDAWESQGGVDLDCNGTMNPLRDLALPGADPARPDVYLVYDYMVLPDQGTACMTTPECSAGQRCRNGICSGHSHAPDRRALRVLVEAFARQGIALHLERGRPLPHHAVVTYSPIVPSCAGDDAVNFYALKSSSFEGRRRFAYHYAVFGHFNTCGEVVHCSLCPPEGGTPAVFGSGGKAELPGNDLMVTLGVLTDLDLDPTLEQEVGVLMHELGHNFGLRHGGDQDLPDFKPNYLSVVNGNFTYVGVPVGDAPGSTTPVACDRFFTCPAGAVCSRASNTCLRMDYSGAALPSLDERHLDENLGIGAGTNDITTYDCPSTAPMAGAGTGPIDWTCNGDPNEPDVAVDINADGIPSTLAGHADWPNLQLEFQCTANGSANGLPLAPALSTGELGIAEAERRHVLLPRRRVEARRQPAAGSLRVGEAVIAVLGEDDLDVESIEGSSLRLDGVAASRLEERDVNGDGRADLLAAFDLSRRHVQAEADVDVLAGWLKTSQAFSARVSR